jgi:hypothetical protein
VPHPRDPDQVVSPETLVICCGTCSWVGLRRTDVMEAAAVAVEHAERSGCDPADALIHPIEVGRGR